MTHRGYYDPEVDSTPLPELEVFPRGEAGRKARVAFFRGMLIGAALLAGVNMAFGETITIGGISVNGDASVGTTVTITPSDIPGEWARVVMNNRHVNDGGDTGEYTLTHDGTVIPALFQWDFDPVLGSDRITLTPPDGIVCVPVDCGVTVVEGMTGEIVLLDWRGM